MLSPIFSSSICGIIISHVSFFFVLFLYFSSGIGGNGLCFCSTSFSSLINAKPSLMSFLIVVSVFFRSGMDVSDFVSFRVSCFIFTTFISSSARSATITLLEIPCSHLHAWWWKKCKAKKKPSHFYVFCICEVSGW